MKNNKIVFSAIIFIFTILLHNLNGQPNQTYDLTFNWKFSKGDNPEWKNPEYIDSSWNDIKIRQSWEEQGFSNYDGYAWYRKKITFPEMDNNQSAILCLGEIDDVDEVFFNGTKIGGLGTLPPNFKTAYGINRQYKIPADLINKGKENTIAVRVFDMSGPGGIITWRKPVLLITEIPADFLGAWFNIDNGQLEYVFNDTLVIYKNALWKYGTITMKKGEGSIQLIKDKEAVNIFIKNDGVGKYRIGLSAKSLINYSNNPDIKPKGTTENDKPFISSVLKSDSVTYSGYIPLYAEKEYGKTIVLHINDILTGDQNSLLVQISTDGTFKAKFPLYHPEDIFIRSNFYNGSIFLEPGKEVFQLFIFGHDPYYMGNGARTNKELEILRKVKIDNYEEACNNALVMSPLQYRKYCYLIFAKNIIKLDSTARINAISAKAYQITKINLEYSNMCDVMEYKWRFESGYRKKNNIPIEQRDLKIKTDTLTIEYFNFITNENTNNPLALICSYYNSFINGLKFSDFFRTKLSIDTKGIADELKKSGHILTNSENQLINNIITRDSLFNSKEYKEVQIKFSKKFGSQVDSFNLKYSENIKSITENGKRAIKYTEIVDSLRKNNIVLTNDEEKLIQAIENKDTNPINIEIDKLNASLNNDSVNKFHQKYRSFVNSYFQKKEKTSRIEILQSKLGVKAGLATDIMTSQDNLTRIVSELSPVSESEIKLMQSEISTPFIASYLSLCNDQVKAKIETNKKNRGYVINQTPKTTADLLFDSIMYKYKGKVVYVDFWATWCGPCRSLIEQVKPLKEDMKGKDVVFVYITGPSSPENTWANMISSIYGEHYRVSSNMILILLNKVLKSI